MTTSPATTPANRLFSLPRPDWLDLHQEETLDPARPIIDAHHHLSQKRDGFRYMVQDLAEDIAAGGHNVIATVYVECGAMYRARGPEAFRPVGEVEFANGVAAIGASGIFGPSAICAGIVGHANLLLGEDVRPVLEAEIAAGNGRFRGIRHVLAWDADVEILGTALTHPKDQMVNPAFRKGFACLAPLGLTYDTFVLQPQIGQLTDLAGAFPETKIVLDHCGGPLCVRGYSNREESFKTWKASIQEIARCQNVVVKLGGLALTHLGYDFHLRETPPSSEEAAKAWRPYIETCIEAFGTSRAMFESNFSPDKGQCSYQVIFNTFKRITASYSETEKTALFSKTASDVYRLAPPANPDRGDC